MSEDQKIVLQKRHIRTAMLKWEQMHRDGLCISADEAAAKSAEEIADENADLVWQLLLDQW